MKLSATTFILVIVSCCNLFLERIKADVQICPPPCYDSECDKTNGNCKYGQYVDYCGYSVCFKSPGDYCGGKLNLMGICAQGLLCQCNICTGCTSDSVDCYTTRPDRPCLENVRPHGSRYTSISI